MMTDYKSRELNIFSADAKNKLRVVSESHAVLESDVFKFKYGLASLDGKGDVTGNMPIYIPKLAADVGGTAVYISDWLWQDRQTIAAEQARALAAESVLRADTKTKYDLNAASISQEVTRATVADAKHTTDIAAEILAREQADLYLNASLIQEAGARQAADTALSSLVATNKGVYDAYVVSNDSAVEGVHIRVSEYHMNYNQRFANLDASIQGLGSDLDGRLYIAEQNITATQNTVMEESGRAQTVEAQLQSQISSLLSNTDAVALNSLAELVADYRVNGSGVSSSVSALADRVLFLEGVIADLVAKSA